MTSTPPEAIALLVSRYGGEHRAPELQKEAVYGLTELHREEVKTARLVANPGCYPTSVQLPLCPLLEVGNALCPQKALTPSVYWMHCLHSVIAEQPVGLRPCKRCQA